MCACTVYVQGGKHKLNNASVLAADVRFLPGRTPQIVNTSLVFSSSLKAKKFDNFSST